MPANFPTNEQKRLYGRYPDDLTDDELGSYFHLTDEDKEIISGRQIHAQLGLAIQLGTVRFIGRFLTLKIWKNIPFRVIDYQAAQLKCQPDLWPKYLQRAATIYDHQAFVCDRFGYHQFTDKAITQRADKWLSSRIELHDETPSVLFDQLVNWLRLQKILLPGITTLERFLMEIRSRVHQTIWSKIDVQLTDDNRKQLQQLVIVGERYAQTDLDRLRDGPVVVSGNALNVALERIRELRSFNLSKLDLEGLSTDQIKKLARHATISKADTINRLSTPRKWATLAAFVYSFESRAIDDALDLFNTLVQQCLSRSAHRGKQERLRTLGDLDTASLQLHDVSGFWLELPADRPIILNDVFYSVYPRAELENVRFRVADLTRPPHDQYFDELLKHYSHFRRFLPIFWHLLEFDGLESEQYLLESITFLTELEVRLQPRLSRLKRQDIINEAPLDIVNEQWWPVVVENKGVNLQYYTFCILLQLRDALRRRALFVKGSERWNDIRNQLIVKEKWPELKPQVAETLGHPIEPAPIIDQLKEQLASAYKQVGDNLPNNTKSRLHQAQDKTRFILEPLQGQDEPPSLITLRKAVHDLLPRIDIQELFQEVATWTDCLHVMKPVSGNPVRSKDLQLSLASAILSEAMNVGLTPFVNSKNPALSRGRLSWILYNYVRSETIVQANAKLVAAQDLISLAKYWGGGEVAVADGLRFVVPVRSVHSAASRRYFGTQKGITWYHWMLDQYMDIHGTVVAGALRDAPLLLDGFLEQETHQQPKELITDTGGYSDIVFGLFWLLGYRYSPRLADIGDARFWRLDRQEDYGVLDGLASHMVNIQPVGENWDDMLRAAGSMIMGTVKASALIKSFHRAGRTSTLGHAIAALGKVAKTLFLLNWVDDPVYRRRVLIQLNRIEHRHRLARAIFIGKRGRVYKKYRDGQEDQLNALGLVVNMVVLWNTRYMNAAIEHLKSTGFDVRDEDIERLSPLVSHHINFSGRYHMAPFDPSLKTDLRPFHDPDDPINLM